MQFDYYKILGITHNSDIDTIKKAYKKKIIQYHPDKVQPTGTETSDTLITKFNLIKKAGEILMSPELKKQHDEELQKYNNVENIFIHSNISELYDSLNINEPVAPEKHDPVDIDKKYEDILLQREQDDIESLSTNIFTDKKFNVDEFNNFFIKREKKNSSPLSCIIETKELDLEKYIDERNELLNELKNQTEEHKKLFAYNDIISNS